MSVTKKKVLKKKTAKTIKAKTASLITTSPKKEIVTNNQNLPSLEKKFININDQDLVIKSKSRLTWLIVGLMMIIIVSFWFWSLKINMKNNTSDTGDLSKVTTEIDNIVSEFKKMVGNSKNIIDQSTTQMTREQEIEKIKNEVLAQIQINADSANWPKHTSDLLGLTINYPTNWDKQEKKDLLILSNYNLKSTTTPEILATITIARFLKTKTTIDDLIADHKDYSRDSAEIFIDLWPTEKYNKNNITEDDLSYLLLIDKDQYIYQIDIYSNNKNIFTVTIDKILSTINLL